MKQLFKSLVVTCIALMMTLSIFSVAAAENMISKEENSVVSEIMEESDSKAYELVWKYKKENGHYYKRRWNKTMNEWYDPAWILVY